ncbi:MAG TPA: menaquinone biosynthesis protein [Vicinamibacteria bacterium]|nr:menaquinone biosynthesis protein [Vicinamibacteria bacterium]
MKPLRLGVVSYLNAAPTVHGLAGHPRFEIVRDVPSRIARLLHAGEVDLGLIPSIEYAEGDYAIVPDVAIASRGPVRSVSLLYRGRLEDARRVAVDTSSRTSAALVRVLLRERLGRDPEYVPMPPNVPEMLEAAEAALVIGDPALYYEGGAARLDLGEEWTALTGRPFVYAFWAGRPGVAGPDDVALLQRAAASGVAAAAHIAASYNGHPERATLNESYLRRNISFELGEAELAGLKEFYTRAHARGLIARVPELRFHGRS